MSFTQMLPLMERLFQMPKLRPRRGTKMWLDFMCANVHHAGFSDIAEYPAIFKAYYASVKKDFNKKGRPSLLNTDVLLWNAYTAPKKNQKKGMLSPRTMSAHSYFNFLRGVR